MIDGAVRSIRLFWAVEGWTRARGARFRRVVGLAVAAALGLPNASPAAPRPTAPAKPRHVMSMNACTDQLVMMLLPEARISSVTYLAEGAAPTPALAAEARRLPINHGLSEEMLAQKPDLALTELFSAATARRLATAAGVNMLVVDGAYSFDDIRRTTRQVAAAVGEPERGEILLRRMDATLAELARTAPARKIQAVGWDGSGRTPGEQSLFDAILTAAGGVNLGAGRGAFARSLDLEQLLALKPKPDLLLYASPRNAAPSLQTAAVRHPVLQQAYGRRRLSVPDYQCGTPEAANQAVALRRAMLDAMGPDGGGR